MSLYWYDSFQNWNTANSGAIVPYDRWTDGGGININTSIYRTGSQSIAYNGWANGTALVFKRLGPGTTPNLANRTDSTMGAAFYLATLPPSGSPIRLFGFTDSSFNGSWTDTIQFDLWLTSTGQLQVTRGASYGGQGTIVATSTNPVMLSTGQWYFVELYTLFHGTTGAYTARVNNVIVTGLQATGANTIASGNVRCNGYLIGGGVGGGPGFSGGSLCVNDFYLLDSSGTVNNTFLGDVHVGYTVVSGNGGTNNLTPNAPVIQRSTAYTASTSVYYLDPTSAYVYRCSTSGTTAGSAPTYSGSGTTTDGTAVFTFVFANANYNFVKEQFSDDSVSYLQSSNVGDLDLYTITPLSGIPAGVASVFAVGIDVRAQRDQAVARGIRALLKSGTTQVDNGADLLPGNGVWNAYRSVFELDPSTSAQWAVSGVNAAKIGLKVSA